jgi:hypothetical protein
MSKNKQSKVQAEATEVLAEIQAEEIKHDVIEVPVEAKAEEIAELEPVLVDVIDVASRHPGYLPSWEASIRSFVRTQGIQGAKPEAVWLKVLAVWGVKF